MKNPKDDGMMRYSGHEPRISFKSARVNSSMGVPLMRYSWLMATPLRYSVVVDNATAYQITVYAIPLGIVAEEKLHPSRPKQQPTRQSKDGLARISFHKDAPYGDDQSHESHQESSIMEHCWLHKVFHKHH